MSVRAWVCGLTVMTTTIVGANERPKERLSVQVSPAVSVAPANLVIRATVEPDAANRALQIVADSEDLYRSSAIQLDGDRAPRTTTFEYRALPPGDYEVTAVVVGANGERRAIARAQVHVIGPGASR